MPKQKQFLYITCSELVFFWVRGCKPMNNLLSYCGLTDARMNPTEKDSLVYTVKNKAEISQNFVAFSEYMNFTNSSNVLN